MVLKLNFLKVLKFKISAFKILLSIEKAIKGMEQCTSLTLEAETLTRKILTIN